MENADIVLMGGVVVTMDDSYHVFDPGAVAVTGSSIVCVGSTSDVLSAVTPGETIDCEGQAVLPGLINAHTHAPMALLRGLGDDLRRDVWQIGYLMPVEREFVRPEFCWLGTQLAGAKMIRSGITCFADMYYFEEAVADAAAQIGIRAVCAQIIQKLPAPDAPSYEDGLQLAEDFALRWQGHELVVPAIGPYAAYASTAKMLRDCAGLATHYDLPVHMHLAETLRGVEEHRLEYGMPVVPWVKKQGLLESKVIAAHCVHLDEGELHTLLHHSVGVAHSPTSNLKRASGVAPLARMIDLGLPVGIGTDGTSSTSSFDMFEEMRLAAMMAKAAALDPRTLPARTALSLATLRGAEALGIERAVGSLEPGKKADVIVVDLQGLNTTPRFHKQERDLYSLLVYAARSADVRHVMCNGRWLMWDHVLTTVDVDAVKVQAARIARRVDVFLVSRGESVLSKLLAIGGVAQKKTFEVQVKIHLSDATGIEAVLQGGDLEVVKPSVRRQYDSYLLFGDADDAHLRYREDEILGADGVVESVRYRLTLTGPTKERLLDHSVVLSGSRFDAPAAHSLRFYREYFEPETVRHVHKERRRYHVRYGGTDFAVNLDRLVTPAVPGVFLEIKSRTWSAQDAERKAALIGRLMTVFGVETAEISKAEYVEMEAE